MYILYINDIVVFIVVKTTVLLADIKDYADVNSVYTKCKNELSVGAITVS